MTNCKTLFLVIACIVAVLFIQATTLAMTWQVYKKVNPSFEVSNEPQPLIQSMK